MMMSARPLIVAALLLGVTATTASAQSGRLSVVPAETPPASFSGSQYVDSRGCVFARAGSNGQVAWVPRFGADRQPVCGFAPTAGGGTGVGSGPATGTTAAETASPPAAEPMPEVIAAAPRPEGLRLIRPDDVRIIQREGSEAPSYVTAPARVVAVPRQATTQRVPARTVTRPAPPAAVVAVPAPSPQPDVEWVMWDGSSPAPIGGNRIWVPRVPGTPAPGVAAPTAPRHARPAPHTAPPVARVVETPRSPGTSGISPFAVPAADPWGWSTRPTPRRLGEPHAHSAPHQTAPHQVSVQPAGASHHYVQVGAFAVPSNAQRTQALLRDRGLPVAVSRQRTGGRELALVMAGPFGNPADLRAALTVARQMGFRDAYIR